MLPNCSADLVQLLSPIREADAFESVSPSARVDDRFLFRRAIWSWHCKTVRRLRAVPPVFRLGVEVLLLLIVTGQLSCLVVLHSVLLPSPFSPHVTNPLAVSLKSALWPESRTTKPGAAALGFENSSESTQERRQATEVLVVEVTFPRHCANSDLEQFVHRIHHVFRTGAGRTGPMPVHHRRFGVNLPLNEPFWSYRKMCAKVRSRQLIAAVKV